MSVRVGFLGAGLIATYHSVMLKGSGEQVERAGVFDPDRSRAEAFATAAGGWPAASEDEVLDSCDAVYVCTWTSEHRRLVEAAAARGIAVFCEKPLSTDLDQARSMVDTVEAAGVTNQVGLVLRYSPAFSLLRDLVAEARSGRVMSVVFRDDQYIPTQGMYGSTWRGDRAKAGAGTLLEHSIHDLDILEWCIGPVDAVNARSANFHGLDGIEDSVATTLRFADGGLGTLVSIWHDVLDRPSLRRIEVFCERAYIVLEHDWAGPIAWSRQDGDQGRLEGDELLAEVDRRGLRRADADGEFIRAVRAGRPAWPTFADALRAHQLTDAVYRSAATDGAPVDVTRPARR
jgi:predicted dehydrogenase